MHFQSQICKGFEAEGMSYSTWKFSYILTLTMLQIHLTILKCD